MATAARERPLSPPPTLGMYWRVFAVNAAILAVAVLLLAFTPIEVSRHTTRAQLLVLFTGLGIMLAANALLLRVSLSPLRRLTSLMSGIDLIQPQRRLEATGSREVAEVIDVFNATLARLEEERRSAIRRVVTAQESERRRIARELHDQIGQDVTAVLLDAERLQEQVSGEQAAILGDMIGLAKEILDELRRISYELRPSALDDLGLASAIEELCTATARRSGITISHRIVPLRSLDRTVELAVYRIAQEALTNAIRHSAATAVAVDLSAGREGMLLVVSDNGTGIRGRTAGGGLRGMRERAHMIGGTLDISRAGASGTRVMLRLPVEAAP